LAQEFSFVSCCRCYGQNWRAKEAFVTSDGKQTRIVGVKSRYGLWWAGSLGVVGG